MERNEESIVDGQSTFLMIVFALLCLIAVVTLVRFPRFEPPTLVLPSPASKGRDREFERKYQDLAARVERLEAETVRLQKDNEDLSRWTLQSLLALQTDEKPASALPSSVATEPLNLPWRQGGSRLEVHGDRNENMGSEGPPVTAWSRDTITKRVLEGLDLYPQQSERVSDALDQVLSSFDERKPLTDEAMVRIRNQLDERLADILTQEQRALWKELSIFDYVDIYDDTDF